MLEPETSVPSDMAVCDDARHRGFIQIRDAITVAFFLSSISLLGGCTQDVILQSSNDPQVVHGRLTINAAAPHFIDIELEGHLYHGEWQSVPKRLVALSQLQDKTSRQYQRIASGLDPAPIAEASSILASPDAPPLKCEWIRHYGHADGSCSLPDGRAWHLTIS